VKALLVHTAVDLSYTGDGTIVKDGPDYKNGYGIVLVSDAVKLIREAPLPSVGGIVAGDSSEPAWNSILEDRVSSVNDMDEFTLPISEFPLSYRKHGGPMKVTLAWDDPPGTSGTGGDLIHDLDLIVYENRINDQGNEEYIHLPWALPYCTEDTREDCDHPANRQSYKLPLFDMVGMLDTRNNVEQVVIDVPRNMKGHYTIVVSGLKLPDGDHQDYSLIITPFSGSEGTDIVIDRDGACDDCGIGIIDPFPFIIIGMEYGNEFGLMSSDSDSAQYIGSNEIEGMNEEVNV
jgi:hypothetical protein